MGEAVGLEDDGDEVGWTGGLDDDGDLVVAEWGSVEAEPAAGAAAGAVEIPVAFFRFSARRAAAKTTVGTSLSTPWVAISASTSAAPGVAETSDASLSMTSMVGAWAAVARSRRITAERIARAVTGTSSRTACDSAAGKGPSSALRIRAATAQHDVPVVKATRISSPPPTGSYSLR